MSKRLATRTATIDDSSSFPFRRLPREISRLSRQCASDRLGRWKFFFLLANVKLVSIAHFRTSNSARYP